MNTLEWTSVWKSFEDEEYVCVSQRPLIRPQRRNLMKFEHSRGTACKLQRLDDRVTCGGLYISTIRLYTTSYQQTLRFSY